MERTCVEMCMRLIQMEEEEKEVVLGGREGGGRSKSMV